MRTLTKQARVLVIWLGGLGMILSILTPGRVGAGDVYFDVFRFGTETLTNATVTGTSKTDVYVSHPGGLINVKIRDLDAETLFKLGLGSIPANNQDEKTATTGVLTVAAKAPVSVGKLLAATDAAKTIQRFQRPSLNFPTYLLLGVAVIGLVIYLFFSYCLKLIVEKAGYEPGLLVWIPLFQMLPMLRAANMSGWWMVGFCVPVALNLVAHVLWAINVVKARGKSVWVTIALLLPVTNLLGFIYLAFSSAENEAATRKSVKPTQPTKIAAPSAVPQRT